MGSEAKSYVSRWNGRKWTTTTFKLAFCYLFRFQRQGTNAISGHDLILAILHAGGHVIARAKDGFTLSYRAARPGH